MNVTRAGARAWAGALGGLLRHPVLRRVLPWQFLSSMGDGMSMVAVAWLALRIAPPGQGGIWTGLAVAAYALPAPLGAAALARSVRRLAASRLIAADAALRAATLGAVAALAVTGHLGPGVYVALLAVSSLLHAWGSSGTYTLIAEQLPEEQRIFGNSLLSTFAQVSFVAGPALAGGLTAAVGPGWAIGADAASFACLALASASLPTGRRSEHERSEHERSGTGQAGIGLAAGQATEQPDEQAAGGWRAIRSRPRLLGLTLVTCVFFFLYGPVEVALPVHVAQDLHGSPGLLGLFWSAFGIGATVGALGAAALRRLRPWVVVVGIVVGWGLGLLPLGLTDAVAPGLVGLAVGGLLYGPFQAISTGLFQSSTPPEALSSVLATRTALTTPAAALGTLLGGPLVGAVGGREALAASALLTVAFGAVAAGVLGLARLRDPHRGSVVGSVVTTDG